METPWVVPQLGALLPRFFFGWEGSPMFPYKNRPQNKKVGTLILTSLLEDLGTDRSSGWCWGVRAPPKVMNMHAKNGGARPILCFNLCP